MTLYIKLHALERDLETISSYGISSSKIEDKTKDIFDSYKSNPILQRAINKEQTIESKFDELYLPRRKLRIFPEKKLDEEYLKQAKDFNELIYDGSMTTRRLGIIVRPIAMVLTMIFSMGNSMGEEAFGYENWNRSEAKYIDDKIKEYFH